MMIIDLFLPFYDEVLLKSCLNQSKRGKKVIHSSIFHNYYLKGEIIREVGVSVDCFLKAQLIQGMIINYLLM